MEEIKRPGRFHISYYQNNTQRQPQTASRTHVRSQHLTALSPVPPARSPLQPRHCNLTTHTAKPPRAVYNKHLLML